MLIILLKFCNVYCIFALFLTNTIWLWIEVNVQQKWKETGNLEEYSSTLHFLTHEFFFIISRCCGILLLRISIDGPEGVHYKRRLSQLIKAIVTQQCALPTYFMLKNIESQVPVVTSVVVRSSSTFQFKSLKTL